MTAPFAPPPSKPIVFVILGLFAVSVAVPFVRRDDLVGWIAFLTLVAVTIGLWGLLIYGFTRVIVQWWRGSAGPDSDS